VAVVLGFSSAIALWAFEFGKDIAGLDRDAEAELATLRSEVTGLRAERERALSIGNTAESLLKLEQAAQQKLAEQLRALEAENLSLKADLGFFERLLPASTSAGLQIRGLQAEPVAPGQLRFQLLLMQPGQKAPEFSGSYEISLSGTLEGEDWRLPVAGGSQPVQIRQYRRVEGLIEHPPQAMVKTVQVRVLDKAGAVKATHTLLL
jgi:hypothetical protein